MPSSREVEALDSLLQWFQTPAGRDLARIEQQAVSDCLHQRLMTDPCAFVVRVGGSWLGDKVLRQAPTARCWALDWEAVAGSDALTGLELLPLRKRSVDLLVLAHALDCSTDPDSLLREAAEVLAPEGDLLVIGFNAWSTWGLRHLRGGPVSRWRQLPGAAGMALAVERHGLERRHQAYHCLQLPWPKGTPRPQPNRRWEQRLAPVLAGIHVLRARKRCPAPISMKSLWQSPADTAPGRLAQPTSRTRAHVQNRKT